MFQSLLPCTPLTWSWTRLSHVVLPYADCYPSPCTYYIFVNSPAFEILSNVTSVEMGGNGTSKITVAYVITPTGESPGYYWLNIPYLTPTSCSIEFPFAYGYSFT